MKLLIIDKTTEAQARCAKKIEPFNKSDIEMLDLKIRLASENTYVDVLQDADVVILGAELERNAINVARHIMSNFPWLITMMFVKEELYGGEIFRIAHSVGIRKVFVDNAKSLDFLQELVAVHSEFKKEGRAREGMVLSVAHAKGGVGATSICAALAEVCGVYNKRTLLWDLDVETRDLSRSLIAKGTEQSIVSSWVNGSQEISRESIKAAILPISDDVSILMPPDYMAESMDLVCHTDSISLCSRILELARVLFDVIIVDTGGRMGPATGTIIRNSDKVLITMDDSVLGLTAVDLYLSFIEGLRGGLDGIQFLINKYTGDALSKKQIMSELNSIHRFEDNAWKVDPLLVDEKANLWPASGKTFYGVGNRNTRISLEKTAMDIELIQQITALEKLENIKKNKKSNFLGKFIKK